MNLKKTNIILKITLIFLGLVLSSCSRLSNDEISKSWWKYGSGFSLGDVLIFDETNLKGDTIFENQESVAIIKSCNTGLFEEYPKLEIESIETGEIGIYYEKGTKHKKL